MAELKATSMAVKAWRDHGALCHGCRTGNSMCELCKRDTHGIDAAYLPLLHRLVEANDKAVALLESRGVRLDGNGAKSAAMAELVGAVASIDAGDLAIIRSYKNEG